MIKPAIGLIELNSIARGIITCDALIKKAPVKVISAMPICPGKYIILFTGDEASVAESLEEGESVADEYQVDRLYLPNVHPQVIPAVSSLTEVTMLNALGIIETFSVASAIVAADVAVKAAAIDLIEVRLARGLAGKSFVVLTGEIADVEAAMQAGCASAAQEGLLVSQTTIPAPHQDLSQIIL
jgi:microcompartment protein CcmL/EutN